MTYEKAFALTGAIIILFSVFFSVFIKDPNLNNMYKKVDTKIQKKLEWKKSQIMSSSNNNDSKSKLLESNFKSSVRFKEMTFWQKVQELTDSMNSQLKKKPILYIVILGASITKLLSVLFSTYLILWINRNIIIEGEESEEKALEQKNLAKDIYINIMVTSALICVIVLPIVGKLCDTIDPRKIMPLAFMARCLTTYLFWLLESPASFETFIVCVAMVVSTVTESVCCDAIFMKNLSKETRGILNGVYSFAGQVGILIFSLVGGWMFDNLGAKSPFVATGCLDFTFTFVFCAFIFGQ